jgi:hypothetical protein
MSKPDKDSIIAKMQSGLGAGFLESIIKQLDPFIEPMITGITESLGNDETMILLRRNKADGKAYVYLIDTSKIESFKIQGEGIKQTIDAGAFVKSMLSGDLANINFGKPDSKDS